VLRHEFQPGKLVAGLFLTLAGVIYAGDAGGLWETPWFAVIPLVVVGLFLAGTVALVTRSVRRRRKARRPEPTEAPTEIRH
jgi:membrane protein implicated in regulation of membrane protease activity